MNNRSIRGIMYQRIGMLLLLFAFALTPYAQKRVTKPGTAKRTTTQKKSTAKPAKGNKSAATPSVQGLQKQREKIQQQIKEQEQRLRNNEKDVRARLRNLMVINSEIEGKRRTIDTIRKDITNLDVEIEVLLEQLDQLQEQLVTCKSNYVKSMRYMHRNRSAQSQLMFIFSADNLTQMFRRLRFMREYASYQRVQGEEVKAKQEEINLKFQQLAVAQEHKRDLLSKGEQERRSLEGKLVMITRILGALFLIISALLNLSVFA